jgi:hypothetical protein
MEEEYILDEDLLEKRAPMVRIRRYASLPEAQVAAAKLRQAGLHCFLSNANTAATLPFESSILGLYVRESDWEEAVDVLRPDPGEEPSDKSNSSSEHPINRVILLILVAMVLLAFLLGMGI